jgi:hypothetical protein
MKNSGTFRMRFVRHGGIYSSDVFLLLASLSRSTAFRSGPGQAIRTRRKETRPTHRRDEFRPAIPRRVARQQSPSPLHRHHQLKSIAASNGIIYHQTVNSLLTVLSHSPRQLQPPVSAPGNTPWEILDSAVRIVFSVPKEADLKQEAKETRARVKKRKSGAGLREQT